MSQSTAIWLVIGMAMVTANLPFIFQKPLVVLPWAQAGEPKRPTALRWVESLVFLGLLGGIAWLFYGWISNAFGMAYGSWVVGYIAVCAVLMAVPAWRARHYDIEKSFVARMVELFVLFLLTGTLAMAFEANIGSRFPQTWQFYAINGCLYLVLGYPSFVMRYLLRRRRRRPASGTSIFDRLPATAQGSADASSSGEPSKNSA